MKKFLLISLLAGSILFVSCGDDEDPIDPVVGVWELDKVEYSSPPSGSVWLIFGSGDISLWGETSYEIEFLSDGTYERELTFSTGRFEDTGEWEKDDEELDLDQDEVELDGLFTSFDLGESSDNDELVLIATDNSWPSVTIEFLDAFTATQDTITTQDSYNTILAENSTANTVMITLTFEK